MVVADLDGDGWLDIGVLNYTKLHWPKTEREGPAAAVRIYWGSDHGFRQEVYREWTLRNGIAMKALDLDNDRQPEMVVLESAPG